ncbi:MFS transporter [Candidatus Micrarchaeota archaeon]|nr:MFS transporter [Candidatus Micrarchaeota archaeon]
MKKRPNSFKSLICNGEAMDEKKGIQGNVYKLGLVSFFNDVSSEMILPILPVFLNTFLGAGKEIIGLIEGVADSLSSLLDIVFGYWSDKLEKRKEFVLLGYGFSSLSKIGIALSTTWPIVFLFRALDRMGKSIRTSPRDALIAASSGKEVRGKAFGLHRAMDTLGAIVGPAIAWGIFSLLGTSESAYREVFYVALVPALLAVLVIFFMVKEPKKIEQKKNSKPNFFKSLQLLSSEYKKFLKISALFSISYFSFALLILRADEIGISTENILLMYLLFNIVYALVSIPLGQLSDKIGRKLVIGGAFVLYALVCLGFAFASQFWQVALLFTFYAVFVAADESVNKAYISDIVKEDVRGVALGTYSTALGAVYLPANILFGIAWATFGAVPAFGAAAFIALISGILLIKCCE